MHEWALAESVVSTAVRVAKEQGLNEISTIKIRVGELQQIDMEVFQFGLKELFQSHSEVFKNTTVEFEKDEAVLKCRVCGRQWSYQEELSKLDHDTAEAIHFLPETVHVYMRCPECRSPDFEITRGRGLWIEWIRGTK